MGQSHDTRIIDETYAPKVDSTSFIGHSFALFSMQASRFLQMRPDGSIGVLDDPSVTPDNITAMRTWETFKFVDGGRGKIALYNETHRRFVRLVDGNVNGYGGQLDENQLPRELDWPSERFSIVYAREGLVAFHNLFHQRFIRLYKNMVDAGGGVCAAELLPLNWASEPFLLVPVNTVTSEQLHMFHTLLASG
jgi:hypothetical protein